MPLLRFIPETTNVNFVKYRFVAFAIDGLLVLVSVISILWHGFNLGIDFTGGVLMNVKSAQVIDISKMRADVNSLGFPESQLQYAGGGDCDKPVNSCVMIRVQPKDIKNLKAGTDQNEADQAVVSAIKGKLGSSVQYRSTEVVGPKVSGELFIKGFEALGGAIALMLLYLWFRFGLQQGLGAVLAVFHDIVLTLGLLSLLQIEFSMTSIAALLTVIGYSMNEKVITFDRLKENLKKFRRTPLADVINLSENERWSRTLITGTTAFLALGGMLFLSGPSLFPLAFTMVFGIVIGTYSSIYVALPVLLLWGVKRGEEDAVPLKPQRT